MYGTQKRIGNTKKTENPLAQASFSSKATSAQSSY